MIICGLQAIRNIRSIHRVMAVPSSSVNRTVVEGSAQSTSSASSKDRQLALILVMDIIVYTPFSFSLAVFLMYQQITQIYIVTIDQVLMQTILTNIFLAIACVPFCTSFYANLIVSKAFRNEVKKVFSCR